MVIPQTYSTYSYVRNILHLTKGALNRQCTMNKWESWDCVNPTNLITFCGKGKHTELSYLIPMRVSSCSH